MLCDKNLILQNELSLSKKSIGHRMQVIDSNLLIYVGPDLYFACDVQSM